MQRNINFFVLWWFPTHPGRGGRVRPVGTNFQLFLKICKGMLPSNCQSTNICCYIRCKNDILTSIPRTTIKTIHLIRRRSSRGCKRQEAGIQFRYNKIRAIFVSISTWKERLSTHTFLFFYISTHQNRFFFFKIQLKIEIVNSHCFLDINT